MENKSHSQPDSYEGWIRAHAIPVGSLHQRINETGLRIQVKALKAFCSVNLNRAIVLQSQLNLDS